MKNLFLFLIFIWLFSPNGINAQEHSFFDIHQNGIFKTELSLTKVSINNPQLKLNINSYDLLPVETDNGIANIVFAPDFAPNLNAGAPNVPHYAKSIIIPDKGSMILTVTSTEYFELTNFDIAPSKGNLFRNINPADVPYVYGEEYNVDAFYPGNIVELADPYILRDFRGQVINFYPFQYNPITKVLRIYTSIEIELNHSSQTGVNEFIRNKELTNVVEEYHHIYSRHFVNYSETAAKYTPVDDTPGNILILCYREFIPDMQPYVDWKITRGYETELVNVDDIGNDVTSLKDYITNYYNTKGITFLLLVGDFPFITSPVTGGWDNGAKDPEYAYILGNDKYPEFIVGRFAVNTAEEVQTLVDRSVHYEKTPLIDDWYQTNMGIASSEGAGQGHNGGESDVVHMRLLQANLMNYHYTKYLELFEGSQGGLDAPGNPTATMVENEFNTGVGSMWYIGHGSETSIVTSGFNNNNINNLTNDYKLSFTILVACVSGKFNRTQGDCFAEAYVKATNSTTGNPTGGVAIYASTINQSWAPPMTGQDEAADILVESYTNNIRRTFGGICFNGAMKMNDVHGAQGGQMTDTWTIFGDPSLMLRTKTPMTKTVMHLPAIPVGSTEFEVECNVEGAFVALTMNNIILGRGYVNNGTATINIPSTLEVGDEITVCVTAYNYVPYLGSFEIMNNNIPNDAMVATIINPSGSFPCVGIEITPEVIIGNMGVNDLTSCTVSLVVNGTDTYTIDWTGNLATLERDTIVFNPIIIQSGTNTLVASTSNPNGQPDGYVNNDTKTTTYVAEQLNIATNFSASTTEACTAPREITFNNLSENMISYHWDFGDGNTSTAANPKHEYLIPGSFTVSLIASAGVCGTETEIKNNYITIGAELPLANNVMACENDEVTLTATATGDILWYDVATGGTPIATGQNYVISSLNNDKTFYVENFVEGSEEFVGEVNNESNGGMFTASNEHYLVFDVFEECILKSVSVNASSEGERTISLRNSTGAVIQNVVVFIPEGISRVELNITLTPGTDYRLVGQGSPNLFRSNTGLNFPYIINDVISIKHGSAANAPTGYYYYYYEWLVKLPDCISGRVPVLAEISSPEVSFTTTNASSETSADGTATINVISGSTPFTYAWSNGQTSQTATELTTGEYTVTITDNNNCSIIETVFVEYNTSVDKIETELISIYPIPANNALFIKNSSNENIYIELVDVLGKQLSNMNVQPLTEISINVSSLAEGIYFIKHNNQINKVVISK